MDRQSAENCIEIGVCEVRCLLAVRWVRINTSPLSFALELVLIRNLETSIRYLMLQQYGLVAHTATGH